MQDHDVNILDSFALQDAFARQHNTSSRTIGRYRAQGLPWVKWNGRVLIGPKDEARAWLLKRVRRTSGGQHG